MINGIGIDLGLKTYAVLSDGREFKGINKTFRIKQLERKLKREQRALSRKLESKKRGGETATKGSNIAKNILRVQKLHQKSVNIRKEYILSIANAVVKTKPQYVTVEDLNIKGMMKNRHLSETIAKQGFCTFKLWVSTYVESMGLN